MSTQGQLQNWGILVDGKTVDIPSLSQVPSTNRWVYFTDFVLKAGATLELPWTGTKTTGTPATPAYLTGATGTAPGAIVLALANTSEAELLRFDWNDHLPINISKKPIIEVRLKIDPDVTGASGVMHANDVIVVGLESAFQTNFDGSTGSVLAQFRFKGGASGDSNIYAESDDDVTDTAPTDTGIDWAAATYMVLKIDLTNLSAVKFIVDGVAAAHTYDMSGVTANTGLQPFIGLYKANAANNDHKVTIDYVKITQER